MSYWFLSISRLHLSQDYERALKYIRILLKNEPGNKQAIDLEKLINEALKKGIICGFWIKCVWRFNAYQDEVNI